MPKRIIYWFRNDLRLHDNEGLNRALESADEILPVFVIDPRWFGRHPVLGFHKTGIYRAAFLLESLADLRQSLRSRGGELIIRTGNPAMILSELAEELDAEAIYASKEVTQEETDLESTLSKRLKPMNIDLELFWMSTLYHVRDLPFSIVKLPDVFTVFRKQVEERATVRETWPVPDQMHFVKGIDAGEIPSLTELGFENAAVIDPRAAIQFKGGETAALARLKHYLWDTDSLKVYKETRNGLLGEDFSSKFSAWLSLGCLSPRWIYDEVCRYEDERVRNDSTYWLTFELIWRDYFRFVALKYGTRLFKPAGIKYEMHKKWIQDKALFMKWVDGETGIPFIDANMRELKQTGFMSNRGRQNVGSFLVKDLGIDWTWGAAWFESMLTDYDVCSNWGNWNYVAGVGNDPREDRYFNIYSQATRYDEQGAYVKHWLPELKRVPARKVHLVSNLNPQEQETFGVSIGRDYPSPVINPNKWIKK
nr:DASH family cryptochrome [uncultured Arsenicibacter sp.]